ncbi:hypothetical protein GF312_11420 [Candidatus Poribacteria bacterium]|nr:hypothetical protein [Candidatus Poribacteria bacterium]
MKNKKDIKNNTELGQLWQEEIMKLSEVTPESLDALENRIEDTLHRLGKAIMEWKLHDWNDTLPREECPDCGIKLHHRKRSKQVLTTGMNPLQRTQK